jgi:hypothetical protein
LISASFAQRFMRQKKAKLATTTQYSRLYGRYLIRKIRQQKEQAKL